MVWCLTTGPAFAAAPFRRAGFGGYFNIQPDHPENAASAPCRARLSPLPCPVAQPVNEPGAAAGPRAAAPPRPPNAASDIFPVATKPATVTTCIGEDGDIFARCQVTSYHTATKAFSALVMAHGLVAATAHRGQLNGQSPNGCTISTFFLALFSLPIEQKKHSTTVPGLAPSNNDLGWHGHASPARRRCYAS